jgi:hypothetical protein
MIVVNEATNIVDLNQIIIGKFTTIKLAPGKEGIIKFALRDVNGIKKAHHEVAVCNLNGFIDIILPEGIFKIS